MKWELWLSLPGRSSCKPIPNVYITSHQQASCDTAVINVSSSPAINSTLYIIVSFDGSSTSSWSVFPWIWTNAFPWISITLSDRLLVCIQVRFMVRLLTDIALCPLAVASRAVEAPAAIPGNKQPLQYSRQYLLIGSTRRIPESQQSVGFASQLARYACYWEQTLRNVNISRVVDLCCGVLQCFADAIRRQVAACQAYKSPTGVIANVFWSAFSASLGIVTVGMIDVCLPPAMTSAGGVKKIGVAQQCYLASNFILIYIAVSNNTIQRRDSIKKYLFSARKHEI